MLAHRLQIEGPPQTGADARFYDFPARPQAPEETVVAELAAEQTHGVSFLRVEGHRLLLVADVVKSPDLLYDSPAVAHQIR